MGAAHCSVVNHTTRPLCILTFNMADLVYSNYHTMYIVAPGDVQIVEANPDAIGLKVAVVYDAKRFKQEFLFHRFTCQNDSILTITSVSGDDIDYYGDGTSLQGKHGCREFDLQAFNIAADALHVELAQEGDRPQNAAAKEVKKFVNNVKTKSEEVISKVAGKEISLDFNNSSSHSNSHQMNNSRSGANVPSRSNSTASLSSSVNTGPSQGVGFGNSAVGEEGFRPNPTFNSGFSNSNNIAASTSNNANSADGRSVSFSSSVAGSGNSQNNTANALRSNSQSQRNPGFASASSSTGPVSTARASTKEPTVNLNNSNSNSNNNNNSATAASARNRSPTADSPPKTEDPRVVTERFEAELERLKKEKKWEQEIERVRRERQMRKEMEEDFQEHPEHFPELRAVDPHGSTGQGNAPGKTAPVVQQAACTACVIS